MMILMNFVSCYWLYLITGLDCGLDYRTKLMDWITGSTFQLNLPHITCLLALEEWTGHMFVVAIKMANYTMSAVTIMVVLSKLLLYPKWKEK